MYIQQLTDEVFLKMILLGMEDGLMMWRLLLGGIIEEAWGLGGARLLLVGVKKGGGGVGS